jgi:hypothetical protein
MMMFIWAVERFKLKLLSYDCRAEGTKLIELDHTEIFITCGCGRHPHAAGLEIPMSLKPAPDGRSCRRKNTAWWQIP